MHAAAREDVGSAPDGVGALAGAGVNELAGVGAAGRLLGTTSGLASSFFHIGHLDSGNWIFEAADRRVGCTATLKSEHSTRLSGCKQEWRVANLGWFPERLYH